jgi:hypothetical protein
MHDVVLASSYHYTRSRQLPSKTLPVVHTYPLIQSYTRNVAEITV